jgi:hypothetical protein
LQGGYESTARSGGDTPAEALEGTESISQIIRTPVVHIMGQQSYLGNP